MIFMCMICGYLGVTVFKMQAEKKSNEKEKTTMEKKEKTLSRFVTSTGTKDCSSG
jgi:hypothetical protein